MGFLKFKSKNKNDLDDSLDIPPPPPLDRPQSSGPQGMDESYPRGLPEFDFPSLPGTPQEKPMFPQQDFSMPSKPIPLMKPMPTFPEMPENKFPSSMPEKPFDDLFRPSSPIGEPLKAQPEMPSRIKMKSAMKEQIFIEVSKYRDIMAEISRVKKELKQSDKEVGDLIGDIEDEEKLFNALNSNLDDIEKRLAELDKTLFG